MPITQERFMNVIIGAKHIIRLNRSLREAVHNAIITVSSQVNSALEHSKEPETKEIIQNLFNRLLSMRDIFAELNEIDIEELTGIILAEEIHFKKAGRKNQKARYYQTIARRDKGIMPRAADIELPTPAIVQRTTPLAPLENMENSPGYENYIKQRNNSRALTTPEIIKKEQDDNTAIFGELDLDKRAEQEKIDILIAQGKLPEGTMRPTNYDARVLATSAPTQEQLNKLPNKPNEDLL